MLYLCVFFGFLLTGGSDIFLYIICTEMKFDVLERLVGGNRRVFTIDHDLRNIGFRELIGEDLDLFRLHKACHVILDSCDPSESFTEPIKAGDPLGNVG